MLGNADICRRGIIPVDGWVVLGKAGQYYSVVLLGSTGHRQCFANTDIRRQGVIHVENLLNGQLLM